MFWIYVTLIVIALICAGGIGKGPTPNAHFPA